MTGPDGLAGSRNAGAGLPTATAAVAAKDGSGSEACLHAGDAGAFESILSDLSRPGDRRAAPSGFAGAGDAAETTAPPARGVAVPRSGEPNPTADPRSCISALVDRIAGTSCRSQESDLALWRDEPDARSPELSGEAGRPAAAGPESFTSALADRVAGTSSGSHDGGLLSPGGEHAVGSPARREDEPGSRGEAGRPHEVAFERREATRRRGGLGGEASPESIVLESAASRRDQPVSSAGLGTGVDPSGSAMVSAAASAVELRPFVTTPERAVEAPGESGGSRRTSTGEPSRGSPMPAEPVPVPRVTDRHGRSMPGDSEGDGDVSWPTAAFGGSRERGPSVVPSGVVPSGVVPPGAVKPDFAEPIFHGREHQPPLRVPAREKVMVLAAETHFPPATVVSPIDQIFHRVTADLGAAIAHADPTQMPGSTTGVLEPRDTTVGCIRTLTVLLEPAGLGSVTIKLRLSGTTLGVEIEAEDVETTRLIGRGRQALTEKLHELGLSVDEFEISDARRARRFP